MSPDDVAYILYTSGTTSTPKGVQLQHRGLIENPWSIGERQHLGPDDRMWMGISLFWSFGCLNALLAVMTHGGCVVLQDQFDAGGALELIERERCTVYYGTPNIALALWEHPDRPRRDLSSLRTGAAIGPPPAMQMVMDLGAREICNVYGLTECYGNSHVTDAADSADVRLHSVGRPLPGMEIRIVDRDTRRPLPPGEVGEILIRGHLTPGYYKDPERNAAAFDAEGFFLSGDLGVVDGDGRLYFRGRIKEMVKTGGINVAPLEVEEVLLGHGSVEQAYVVGLPDPRREEILAAAVVLKDRHAAPSPRRCGPTARRRWPRSRCRSTSGSWRGAICPSPRRARSRSSGCRSCSPRLRRARRLITPGRRGLPGPLAGGPVRLTGRSDWHRDRRRRAVARDHVGHGRRRGGRRHRGRGRGPGAIRPSATVRPITARISVHSGVAWRRILSRFGEIARALVGLPRVAFAPLVALALARHVLVRAGVARTGPLDIGSRKASQSPTLRWERDVVAIG